MRVLLDFRHELPLGWIQCGCRRRQEGALALRVLFPALARAARAVHCGLSWAYEQELDLQCVRMLAGRGGGDSIGLAPNALTVARVMAPFVRVLLDSRYELRRCDIGLECRWDEEA